MRMATLFMAGLLLAADPNGGEIVPVPDRGFQIPVRFDEKVRSQIREVILFESADKGLQWNQRAVNPPTKESFVVNVPADGWYWYTICVVDQKGQRQPSDPSMSKRIMKVLVDTKRPDVRLTATRQGEGVVAEWNIQEENPKLATLKLEYHTSDMQAGQWAPVRVDPKLVGSAGFPVTGTAALTVRLEIHDEADNVGSHQVDIPAAPAPVGVPFPGAGAGAGPTPATDGGSGSPFPTRPVGMSRDPVRTGTDSLAPPPITSPSTVLSPSNGASTTGSGMNSGVVAATGAQSPALGVPPVTPPAPTQRGPVPGLEYVNTNRVTIQYNEDKIG